MQIIYGGSFNPPTIAHVQIAKFLLMKFPEAEFIFLPTNNFYIKDSLKDFKLRVQMLEIICNKLDNRPQISDFELKLDRFYGTDYTLNHFPNAFFVIGADNLLTISNWLNFPNVVINHQYIVIPRNNLNTDEIMNNDPILNKYRHHFMVLNDFHEIYVSSSDYRKTKNNDLLIPEIANFIKENHLYKE
ncbi:MAG: nicotinate-nicotinamide nucleotide adenylyltransferase [Bacilli bacterium]